jgi:hypothetical protein
MSPKNKATNLQFTRFQEETQPGEGEARESNVTQDSESTREGEIAVAAIWGRFKQRGSLLCQK